MERYRMPTPRTTLALAAALAASATLALAVLPTGAPVERHAPLATGAPTEVAIVPSRIEVVGVRAQAAADNEATPERRSAGQPG